MFELVLSSHPCLMLLAVGAPLTRTSLNIRPLQQSLLGSL